MNLSDIEYERLLSNFIRQNEKIHFWVNTISTYKKTLEQMSIMLDAIDIGVISFDLNKKSSIFNNQFLKMWNLEEEVVEISNEKELFNLIIPKQIDSKSFADLLNNLDKFDNSELFGILNLTNGRIIEFSINSSNNNGDYYGRVWTFHDITELDIAETKLNQHNEEFEFIKQQLVESKSKLQKTEEMLKAAQEQFQLANNQKMELINNLVKNIRKPLRTILETASLMRTLNQDIKQIDYSKSILSSGKILYELINQLDNINQIGSNQLSISLEPVDFNEFKEEINQIYALQQTGKNVNIQLEFHSQIPKVLLIDKAKMLSVIINLINYLSKYQIYRDIKLDILIDRKKKSKKLINLIILINHSDRNTPKEQSIKVSNEVDYKQPVRINIQSSELELIIARKLIELMDGNLIVLDNKDENVGFKVTLPDVAILETSWKSNNSIKNIEKELIQEELDHVLNKNLNTPVKHSKIPFNDNLKTEIYSILEEAKQLSSRLIIDELDLLANKILKIGIENKIKFVKEYGMKLKNATDSLNIVEIKKLLNSLNTICLENYE